MRVWDVAAGYLSRQSLLGEHRELHGLHVVVTEGKTGYSRHPETRRWVGAVSGLRWRHAHLAAEMRLRGYVDRTPLPARRGPCAWPRTFVTTPAEQIALLRRKYAGGAAGRIPLPRNPQELWAQHKYSVMARDPEAYRRLGRVVAGLRGSAALDALARDLVLLLRQPPDDRRTVNALEHMWGYVREDATPEDRRARDEGLGAFLRLIQRLAASAGATYLLHSTALSELDAYVVHRPQHG